MKKLEIVCSINIRSHQEYEYKQIATEAVSQAQEVYQVSCKVKAYVKVDDVIQFVIMKASDEDELWTYCVESCSVYTSEEEIPFYVYMLLENVDGKHRCITR